jgi:hypothetical protein
MVKNKKKLIKMERIDENSVFIEINQKTKYNEYNQVNIIDKLQEIYVIVIKFLFKFNQL